MRKKVVTPIVEELRSFVFDFIGLFSILFGTPLLLTTRYWQVGILLSAAVAFWRAGSVLSFSRKHFNEQNTRIVKKAALIVVFCCYFYLFVSTFGSLARGIQVKHTRCVLELTLSGNVEDFSTLPKKLPQSELSKFSGSKRTSVSGFAVSQEQFLQFISSDQWLVPTTRTVLYPCKKEYVTVEYIMWFGNYPRVITLSDS